VSNGRDLMAEISSLKAEVVSLEERVAFSDLARDNALAMAEEAQKRSRGARASAGEKISRLITHIRGLERHLTADQVRSSRAAVAEILDKGEGCDR
jgi:hypothetical protein